MVSKFDGYGFMDYLPLKDIKLTFENFRLKIFKLAMESCLANISSQPLSEDDITVFMDNYSYLDENFNFDISKLYNILDIMVNLCIDAMIFCKSLIKISINNEINTDNQKNYIAELFFNLNGIDNSLLLRALAYDELYALNIMHRSAKESTLSYDLFGIAFDRLKNFSRFKLFLKTYKKFIDVFLEEIKLKFN
jgi:hypothetical protein